MIIRLRTAGHSSDEPKGIVLSKDGSLLFENGGHIQLSKSQTHTVMTRMGMVKRNGEKKSFTVHFENVVKIPP